MPDARVWSAEALQSGEGAGAKPNFAKIGRKFRSGGTIPQGTKDPLARLQKRSQARKGRCMKAKA